MDISAVQLNSSTCCENRCQGPLPCLTWPSIMAKQTVARNVGIIGTGNFARALANRLYYAGYNVILGSRKPDDRSLAFVDECMCNINMTTIEDCLKRNAVIFVAVHAANYKDCLLAHSENLQGKILIDVSNRDQPSKTDSNAEYLNKLIPAAIVVKGFNVISAYAMEIDSSGGSRQVFIASDNNESREKVSVIARDMGFAPVDMGLLQSSRKIEAFPLKLLPEWRGPVAFAVGVFNIWLLYIIFIYFVEKTAYRWDQIFVKVLNKPLCMTAITVISCTYLPSSVASFFQIYYGTKHIRFPAWLDRWLRARKQLGLVAFTLVVIHVIMSVLIMSPTYLSSWYQSTSITIPGNLTHNITVPIKTWMVWKGEAACLAGILAFISLCVIAISTIPSVTNTLNWREWRFVQSKLGHLTMFLSLVHVIIMGAPGWAKGPMVMVRSITFLSSVLPFLTLFFKLVLSLPFIGCYIKKIRRGWERYPTDCRAECAPRNRKPFSPGYVIVPRRNSFDKGSSDVMIPMEEAQGCTCENTSTV
ncbi:metalloreductase STEAP2-like isoform X2 [Mizuhopecten yessoensis]|uniref:metalloreductase STEAP2-like isoform X2 n=1 Tax=Mizuhopecten yessoensis TaxID=6573 RepID=UPI000B45CF7B|nr:metalloreductase STEAP2-like isoform X2 [Mizuhopecten yessoensis]